MGFCVRLGTTGETFTCEEGEPFLRGMRRLGRRGIPQGCFNGGCGVCKVRIVSGKWRQYGPMSGAHITPCDLEDGVVLACRTGPVSDVELEVVGGMAKRFELENGQGK